MDPQIRKSYKQMIMSLFIKFLGMGVSLLSVPIILKFISYEEYGIYLALTSSFALINVLDIGLGDSLRNKFAEARSNGDLLLLRIYVSTTYVINFILTILIIVLYFFFEKYIDWNAILNISSNINYEIKQIAEILIISTAIQFFLQAILNILKGDQKYISYSIINLILNLVSIFTIIVLINLDFIGSIFYLTFSFFIIPNVCLLLINYLFFIKSYKDISPSIKYFKLYIVKTLTLLSFKFFIINIISVISISSINIIVIRNFKSSAVVDFNLLFKYYFLLISIAFIVFNPIWSTFTESIVKRDVEWTKKLLKKSIKGSLFLSLFVPIMIIFANPFISRWSGTTFNSSFLTNFYFGIWVILVILSEPYKMLIKGSGDLNAYLFYSIVFIVVQISISLFLIYNFKLGFDGILLGCIVSQLLFLIFFYKYSNKIILKIKSNNVYKT